ncbi:hypothetical protein SmJEL517_g02772 [Synchytrium microbalum]|uniref:Group 1 truncated hemoglobin n=1 Tax=Synchytrium microbalum TaxID=1806994 RepID=A0A507CB35_9FUNG|nr:uncharacterized protein SmJEL517_g02772 [Synchytrium microbalum]TPX34743.1 hypothetical protein SmJEL517_g02772 [Synchytrium microbalum]
MSSIDADTRTSIMVAGFVGLVGVIGYMAYKNTHGAEQKKPEVDSLYKRIGGEPAVDATVEKFYDLVIADPLLQPFFKNTNMKRQRGMQKAFFNHVLGGKPYNGKNMKEAHAKMGLKDEHFDAVARHLKEAMESLNVPTSLINEVLAVAETTRNDVLGRY